MLERLVELRGGFLQLHSDRQTVRGVAGATSDAAFNFFLDVDERFFQC